MERRLTVHAGATRLVVAALLFAGTPATAAPKRPDAKAAFDRGVAAYSKKDWPAAAEALGKSYTLEPDVETLYAWAQAERQQDHCAQAIELWEKLLVFDLPAENRKVISGKLDECKAIEAAKKPEPKPQPAPEPAVETPVAPVIEDKPAGNPEPHAWWKNPVGGAFVTAGVIGLGFGGYFLVSAKSADSDAKKATNYFDTERLNDKAESHGRNGVIGLAEPPSTV